MKVKKTCHIGVLSQDFAVGFYVAKGSAVNPVISTGSVQVNVPDVTGRAQGRTEGLLTTPVLPLRGVPNNPDFR